MDAAVKKFLIDIIFSDSSDDSDSENKICHKKKRKFRLHPYYRGRDSSGAFVSVFQSIHATGDETFFINYLRMTSTQLEELLQMVGPLIKKETVLRKPISPDIRLVITLRYLATGESQQSLAFSYKCSPQSVHRIIVETTKAITMVLKGKVFPKLSKNSYVQIAEGFQSRWNFPNCIGAVDGKHVTINTPPKSGSDFFNYKNTSSIVLLGICDHNYSFIMCDIGASGQQSDGGIFSNSEFGRKFYSNSLSLPEPRNVAEDLQDAPYVFVADAAFSLMPNMLKPYGSTNLSHKEKVFNYRLRRARRVIENTFGILTAKWRIYKTTINANVSLVENIIQASVCLHNWLRNHSANIYLEPGLVDKEVNGKIIPGTWRSEGSNMLDLKATSTNTATNLGKATRDKFADYFIGSGAVDWQDELS